MEHMEETVEIDDLRRVKSLSSGQKSALVRFFPSCTLKYIDYLGFMCHAAYHSLVLRSGAIRPLEILDTTREAVVKVERYIPMDFCDWMDYLDAHCDNKVSDSLVDEISIYFECLEREQDPFTINSQPAVGEVDALYMNRVLDLFLNLSETLTRIIRISCYCSLKTDVRKWYEFLLTSMSTIFTEYLQKIEWKADRLVFTDITMAENLLRSIGEQSKKMYDLNDQLLDDLEKEKCYVLNVEYMKFLETQTKIDENYLSYSDPSDSTNIFVDNSGDEINVWYGTESIKITDFTVVWTPENQNVFFKALARYSIHFIDCIHRMLPDKTVDDIRTFYDILKGAVQYHVKKDELKTGYAFMSNVEAAYEVSSEWENFEDQSANAITNFEFQANDLPSLQPKFPNDELGTAFVSLHDDVSDNIKKVRNENSEDNKINIDIENGDISNEEKGVFFKHSFDDEKFHLNKIYQKQVKCLLEVDSVDKIDINKIQIKENLYQSLEDYGKRYLKKLMKEIIQNYVNDKGKYLHLGLTDVINEVTELDVWNAVENVPCIPQAMVYTALDNISNYLHFTSGFNKFDNQRVLIDLNALTRRPVSTYLFNRRLSGDDVEKYCQMIYMLQDCIETTTNKQLRLHKLPDERYFYLKLLQELLETEKEGEISDEENAGLPAVQARLLTELDDDSETSEESESESESEDDSTGSSSQEYESANEELTVHQEDPDPYDSSISVDFDISSEEENQSQNDDHDNGPPRKKQRILALLEDPPLSKLPNGQSRDNETGIDSNSEASDMDDASNELDGSTDDEEIVTRNIVDESDSVHEDSSDLEDNEEEEERDEEEIARQKMEEQHRLEYEQFVEDEKRRLHYFIILDDGESRCDEEKDDFNEIEELQLEIQDCRDARVVELDLIEGMQMGQFFDGFLTGEGILRMRDEVNNTILTK